MSGGVLDWQAAGGTPAYRLGFRIGSAWIRGQGITPPHSVEIPSGGVVLATLGRTDVPQYLWMGEDQPINLEPVRLPLDFVVNGEAGYWALRRVSESGEVVDAYLDLPAEEAWSIPLAASGQTLWKTARRLPWDVPGVTTATRPPKAYIDTTEQTVVATAGPAAGEVYVPATGGFASIETPSGITGSRLVLRYHPLLSARVTDLRLEYREPNGLRVSCTVEEVRGRRW